LPYDVAVTKHHDRCAELLRPDDDASAEEQNTSKDQTPNGETETGNKEDDSRQSDVGDDKRSSSGKESLSNHEKNTADETDDDEDKHQKDESGEDSGGLSGNSDVGDDDNDTADKPDNNQDKDSSEKQPEENMEPGSDDRTTNEDQAQDGSTKERDAKDRKTADAATSKGDDRTTGRKPQTKKDDVGKNQPSSSSPSRIPVRQKDGAPSTTDDRSNAAKPNERRRDRQPRKPAGSEPTPGQNRDKSAQNSRPKDDQRPGRSGAESPRKEAQASSIPEHVRIYEMRQLASRELEKTRRYRQQLGHTGGPMSRSSNKQLTRLLTEDYNEKAHRGYHIEDDQVKDLDELTAHLQGKISSLLFLFYFILVPFCRITPALEDRMLYVVFMEMLPILRTSFDVKI